MLRCWVDTAAIHSGATLARLVHRDVLTLSHSSTSQYDHFVFADADYDIVIWSATSMKWVEVKMRELGVSCHPDYKLSFMLGERWGARWGSEAGLSCAAAGLLHSPIVDPFKLIRVATAATTFQLACATGCNQAPPAAQTPSPPPPGHRPPGHDHGAAPEVGPV